MQYVLYVTTLMHLGRPSKQAVKHLMTRQSLLLIPRDEQSCHIAGADSSGGRARARHARRPGFQ